MVVLFVFVNQYYTIIDASELFYKILLNKQFKLAVMSAYVIIKLNLMFKCA